MQSKSRRSDDDPRGTQDLVAALLTASRALVGVSARSMAHLDGVVTMPQFRTLVVLSHQPSSGPSALAERLGVTPSTAVRTIDRLVDAGLVTRTTSTTDRREVVVALTRRGRRLVDDVTARRSREIERIVAAMPTTRRTQLVAALRAFAEAADEPSVIDPGTVNW